MSNLHNIKTFLLDMDGTFYLGDQIFPCSYGFLDKLKEIGADFLFLTNNSSKSGLRYVEKLAKMGLSIPQEKVFTSGEATAIYLKKEKPGAKIYLVGTPALEEEFQNAGFHLTDQSPDYVVLGFDTTLTYEKLIKLCDFVRAGFPYIATHPDLNCPVEGGFIPDIGGVIALVKTCAGREPDIIIGKPYAPIVDALLEKTHLQRDEIAMVGDRLYTDIAMGVNSSITSILVLSGETSLEDAKRSDIKPDYVFQDLGELASQL